MESETGATVMVDGGLCKLVLTAPCSHLIELLEDPFTYICFTMDSIRRHIKYRQPIIVNRCIKVNRDFTSRLFCPTLKKQKNSLPSSIFEFYPSDPAEDDSLLTMAAIFQFSSTSKLDYKLAECVERLLLASKSFAENFYYHALLRGRMKHYSNEHSDCDKLILIQLQPSSQEIVPVGWSYKLQALLWKRLQLEDAMNWLNTLGGGYSAMGDYFIHHSMKAAEISGIQLSVALELGDVPTVIRCHLYFALSLMQRGRVRNAKYRLRFLYRCAQHFRETDPRLTNMCLGLWSRLRYFYKLKHKRHLGNGLCDKPQGKLEQKADQKSNQIANKVQ